MIYDKDGLIPDLDKKLILPDSRVKDAGTPKGSVMGPLGWMQPIFCASCHEIEGGLVPEESCTFAFWLCNDCVDKHGHIEGTYVEPDELFWQRIKREQLEQYGRVLSNEELQAVAESNTSPLATLINKGR